MPSNQHSYYERRSLVRATPCFHAAQTNLPGAGAATAVSGGVSSLGGSRCCHALRVLMPSHAISICLSSLAHPSKAAPSNNCLKSKSFSCLGWQKDTIQAGSLDLQYERHPAMNKPGHGKLPSYTPWQLILPIKSICPSKAPV